MPKKDSSLNLHVGEWVEVKSADEILATLDDRQSVDHLPFMPEMLQYCSKRFCVFKSAHKTADTCDLFDIRRMARTVHLDGPRCDGAGHGGCQAGCQFFFKECWIKRVPADQIRNQSAGAPAATALESGTNTVVWQTLAQGSQCPVADGEPQRYRCQATEMNLATTIVSRLGRWNPLFYVKDITSGNVRVFDFLRYGALAILNSFIKQWFNFYFPRVRGLCSGKTPTQVLNLQPGEWVRVKSKREIMLTLDRKKCNRGLWFDAEMVPYCGKGNFRVLRRVEKLIHEKTGRMLTMTNPCIILDGLVCLANHLPRRLFSPRQEYLFWREIWLERASAAAETSPRI